MTAFTGSSARHPAARDVRGIVKQWIDSNGDRTANILDRLLWETELNAHRDALLAFVCDTQTRAGLLAEIDRIADNEESYPSEFLSERLAHAGLLPMFGFRTHVRNLYLKEPKIYDWPPDDIVDREVQIAISQFTGSETVKDKTVYRAVGVAHYFVFGGGLSRRTAAAQRTIGTCGACHVLTVPPGGVPPDCCPVCGAESDDYRRVTVWEPLGFLVEPKAERDYNGRFEWMPRDTTRLDSAEVEGFCNLEGTNLALRASDRQVLSVNDNDRQLFGFQKFQDRRLWVVPEELEAVCSVPDGHARERGGLLPTSCSAGRTS